MMMAESTPEAPTQVDVERVLAILQRENPLALELAMRQARIEQLEEQLRQG